MFFLFVLLWHFLGLEEMQDENLHCGPDGRQQHPDEEGSGHVPLPAENRGWGGGGGDGESPSLKTH